MTQTTTSPPQEADAGIDTPEHPTDVLMNLIVLVLAPMFLTASGGDILFARMAALETINAYAARNHADLIAIAQIIACGLTALGSLSLSMADDLSLSMTLRLRGNANALMRSAETSRRGLGKTPTESSSDPGPDPHVTTVETPQPGPRPQDPTPTARPKVPAPTLSDQQRQAMWASAMAEVANEFSASLPFLPPTERKSASMRAAALNSTANILLSGPVPPRPRPGALSAIMRPTQ
jgi:hypothetical protein